MSSVHVYDCDGCGCACVHCTAEDLGADALGKSTSEDIVRAAQLGLAVLAHLRYREEKRATLTGSRYNLQRAHWHAGNGYLDILGDAYQFGLIARDENNPRTEDGTRPDPRGPRPLEDREVQS